jgi:plasmid maintenance system antidote protein VapI
MPRGSLTRQQVVGRFTLKVQTMRNVGLSFGDIAATVGITRQQISDFISGRRIVREALSWMGLEERDDIYIPKAKS